MLKEEIKAKTKKLAKEGSFSEVRSSFRELLEEDGGTSTYVLLDRLSKDSAPRLDLPKKRVALLSSFTLEPISPFLRVRSFLRGCSLETQFFAYQQWQAELAQDGPLSAFKPDAVLLLLHPDDILPNVEKGFLNASPEQLEGELASFLSLLEMLLKKFRSRSEAFVIIGTLPLMNRELERFWGHSSNKNRRLFLERANEKLAEAVSGISGTSVYPYAAFVEDFGRMRFFDTVKNNLNQAAIHSSACPALAEDLVRYFGGLWSPRHKCIVLDLDNTLWGGVVAEDGLDGIILADEGPGKAYRNFQLFLKELHATGVMLAVNSKNNPADAEEVFEKHKDCVLSLKDFSAIRINWEDKAANLKAISEELNIGLDSMIFIDDSPMECERIATAHPEVTVVPFDRTPEVMAKRLLDVAILESAQLSADDYNRNESYRAEIKRREEGKAFKDYGEFLSSLELKLRLTKAKPEEIARLSQLAGKTNQFNTTTVRYTAQEIEVRMHDSNYLVASLALEDKYGDYGIIGMVILEKKDALFVIECYLMSCRVLGRCVESAVISMLQRYVAGSHGTGLVGAYRPTAKNIQVASLYPNFGFSPYESSGQDAQEKLWVWQATQEMHPAPAMIQIETDIPVV